MTFRRYVRAQLTRLLGRYGYAVVPSWRWEAVNSQLVKSRPLSAHLRSLLSRLECDCVLDVGANRGQFRDFLRDEVGYVGPIVSYEPLPERAAELEVRAASDSLWEVRRVALGSEVGRGELNAMASDDFSSFLAPSDAQPQQYRDANVVTRRITVPVTTLALEIERLELRHAARRIFLKMDTQGYDVRVFRGGGTALRRVVAMQSELSLVPLYDQMTPWLDALREYQAEGFAVSALVPVSLDAESLRPIEIDCVLVRPDVPMTAERWDR